MLCQQQEYIHELESMWHSEGNPRHMRKGCPHVKNMAKAQCFDFEANVIEAIEMFKERS